MPLNSRNGVRRGQVFAPVSYTHLDVYKRQIQDVFQLSATDTTIFAPDSDTIIGHGHYSLSHADGLDIVEGENKYLDGEYDQEQQSVRPSANGLPPVSYTHLDVYKRQVWRYAPSARSM